MSKNITFALLTLVSLGTSHAVQAADQAPIEAMPAQTIPANPDKETVKQSASNTQPDNDKLVDYRYCLELKTNREITECRYKKK